LVGGRAPAGARSRVGAGAPVEPPSPRIAAVLAIEEPTVAALAQFLTDADAQVRRTAVATLTEHTPDGYAAALMDALADSDAAVRRTAADGVRELVEVLPYPDAAREFLASADAVVRSVSVYLLAARRAGDAGAFRHAVGDVDHRVRIEAVRALVSVDDADGVAAAARDDNREVRIVAAGGLATLRAGRDTVRSLVADTDPLVRAAALAALGEIGCDEADLAAVQRAAQAPAWQVREGAARALSGATAELAVPLLSQALVDEHLDVRKAAVLSLSRWADSEAAARDVLSLALKDDDADVRAYARRALACEPA
jgi:HEAT repeat protein